MDGGVNLALQRIRLAWRWRSASLYGLITRGVSDRKKIDLLGNAAAVYLDGFDFGR